MKVIVQRFRKGRSKYKFRAQLPNGRHVRFGAQGYSDFTIHKDRARMKRYIARHSKGGQDWSRRGVDTAGWWSRWLLWSAPSLQGAKRLIKKRFGITVQLKI